MITKFNLFARDNYVEDICKTIDGIYNTTVVVIYRAKCMKNIPERLRQYIYDIAPYGQHIGQGRRKFGHNPDFGDWDAIMIDDIVFNKEGYPSRANVYITAILRRPFTKEQQDYYEGLCALPLKERLFHPWDSESSHIPKEK